MDFSTLQLLEGLVFALKSGAAADFLKSGQMKRIDGKWLLTSSMTEKKEQHGTM
jgi:hypothetical protein